MDNMNIIGQPIAFSAADGQQLAGFLWLHRDSGQQRSAVLICSATSVQCRYYARFAHYLYENGFNVMTFDYRGIGASRPASLRGLQADWADWGEHDIEGAIRHLIDTAHPDELLCVAHSIGGFAFGLAPSSVRFSRIVTVGAQFAYWRDYAKDKRLGMFFKWHLVMPVLTRILGYFPAKRLRWMEDTPAGVALDWAGMGPAFETSLRQDAATTGKTRSSELKRRLSKVRASILALAAVDDPFATSAATQRLLSYYTGSQCTIQRLDPAAAGVASIGHFAYFHDRFRNTLWPLAVEWLNASQDT